MTSGRGKMNDLETMAVFTLCSLLAPLRIQTFCATGISMKKCDFICFLGMNLAPLLQNLGYHTERQRLLMFYTNDAYNVTQFIVDSLKQVEWALKCNFQNVCLKGEQINYPGQLAP